MEEVSPTFARILEMAQAMGLLKVGTVNLDGTKVKASASRHKALSYGYVQRLEAPLNAEVSKLLRLAEQADQNEKPDGIDIPSELARRETRLAAMTCPPPKKNFLVFSPESLISRSSQEHTMSDIEVIRQNKPERVLTLEVLV